MIEKIDLSEITAGAPNCGFFGHQGMKTIYSNEEKNNLRGDLERYFTIEQEGNKVFLRKEQVSFIINKGLEMMDRWKIGDRLPKNG